MRLITYFSQSIVFICCFGTFSSFAMEAPSSGREPNDIALPQVLIDLWLRELRESQTATDDFLPHSYRIKLPKELDGKAFEHLNCECEFNIPGYYCGEYALIHAVIEEQRYGLRSSDITPIDEVKKALVDLNITNRRSVQELARVAKALNLDHEFFRVDEKGRFTIYDSDEDCELYSEKRFIAWRAAFCTAGNRPMIKHAFFRFQNHGNLFCLVWDGEQFFIKLYDNLNEPIQAGSECMQMSQKLEELFADQKQNIAAYLIRTFVPPVMWSSYVSKVHDYKRSKDINHIKELVTELLEKRVPAIEEQALKADSLDPLKVLLDGLKQYYFITKTSHARETVILCYNTMLNMIDKSQWSNDCKISKIKTVMASIFKSAEQEVFSVTDGEGREILSRAKRMLLQLFRQ